MAPRKAVAAVGVAATVLLVVIGIGQPAGVEARQAQGFYIVVQQTVRGPHCVIVNAPQVTDRRVEFVEWTTDAGPIRIYTHGVSLAYVQRQEDLGRSGLLLGIDVAQCRY